MTTRQAGSGYGAPINEGTRAQGASRARSAASGIPTVYTSCQELTKAGQPCQAPNVKGGRTCVGHGRKLSAEQE